MLLDLSDLFSKLNDSNSTLVQFDESIIRQYLLLSFTIAKLYLTSFHFSPPKNSLFPDGPEKTFVFFFLIKLNICNGTLHSKLRVHTYIVRILFHLLL